MTKITAQPEVVIKLKSSVQQPMTVGLTEWEGRYLIPAWDLCLKEM